MPKAVEKPKSKTAESIQSAYTLYYLYTNWDKMNGAQKSIALTQLGMTGYKFSTGNDIGNQWVVEPKAGDPTSIGMTVGDAFNLFASGYNAYALAKNWDQMSTIQKIVGGGKSVVDLAALAKNMNLLGFGSQGAAVQGASEVAKLGWSSASNYGVGAVTAKVGTVIPPGYQTIMSGGEGVIAVPAANSASAIGAASAENLVLGSSAGPLSAEGFVTSEAGNAFVNASGTAATEEAAAAAAGPSTLSTAAGALGFAAGAYQVYQGWGAGGTKGAVNGVLGGSMMLGGLYAMSALNPYTAGAVIATSLLGNMIKTGKHEDQKGRDGVLSFLRDKGLVSDKNTVTLPDGSVIDLGIDGGGNLHSVTNADLLAPNDKKRGGANGLGWYDIDYTNDLDYTANMGTQALMAILGGGKNQFTSQVGGKLANGVLQGIGYGQALNEENFSKVQGNLRSVFSQFGVTSKADAFQLLNQMFAEERINESDLIAYQQGVNSVFDDNGFSTIQQLMSGRHRGAEVAAEDMDSEPNNTVSLPGVPSSIDPGRFPAVKSPTQTPAPGASTFSNPPPEVQAAYAPKPMPRPQSTPTQTPRNVGLATGGQPMSAPGNGGSMVNQMIAARGASGPMGDKEEARARNQQTYLSSFG